MSNNKFLYKSYTETPIGKMLIGVQDQGLCVLEFTDIHSSTLINLEKNYGIKVREGENQYTSTVQKQLQEYFEGKRIHFEIPISFFGTNFQKKVWNSLLHIPYGKFISYKQQAFQLNNVKGVRAVAGANARNRIPIVVPCHRVIGTNGNITGYRGGTERKQWLLRHESCIA